MTSGRRAVEEGMHDGRPRVNPQGREDQLLEALIAAHPEMARELGYIVDDSLRALPITGLLPGDNG